MSGTIRWIEDNELNCMIVLCVGPITVPDTFSAQSHGSRRENTWAPRFKNVRNREDVKLGARYATLRHIDR